MAEAEGIPPTASVASVGPGIRYISNWAYGYSGTVNVGVDPGEILLEFHTGSGLIVAQLQFEYVDAQTGGSQILATYTTKFNDIVISEFVNEAEIRAYGGPENLIPVIIPPFTKVAMSAFVSGGTKNQAARITGRVYDV